MKIRLHEIELGTKEPDKSKAFYESVLLLETAVDQDGLKVFKTGIAGVDLNASTHLPAKETAISFITDDLQAIINNLQQMAISFEGPHPSHLGMMAIDFKDPDGYTVHVNTPTTQSPAWLTV